MSIYETKHMMTIIAGILVVIFSNGTIDSFAQSELTTFTQSRGSDVTSVNTTTTTTTAADTTSHKELLFVEQGRITGQRVLAVTPQPQIETNFMANTSITNDTNSVVNAINIGTTTITLNADGTFRGEGQGVLRSEDAGFASWTSQTIGNLTQGGEILVRGVTFWSTPPSSSLTTADELEFMDGVIGLFEMEIDRLGNLSVIEWKWDS